MHKWMWIIGLLALLFFSPLSFAVEKAVVLNITGPIGPATQDYIERGIAYAEKEQAGAIILQIDTPGGLDSSMRGINEAIIKSKIPVIAYVTPAGARAGSAGVYIMYASHFAAMAQGTNVGAASPVSLGGTTKAADDKNQSAEEKKAVNDSAAYIRSLAELRGRNVNFAEQAVRQASSISATDAKRLNVIDVIANDYPQLLNELDGHNTTVAGVPQTVKTKNLKLQYVTPDWRYQFLSFITNPNVAYILMLVAIYGLFFELSNPGLVLPGVAGIICLLLVLYAFQLMPINYAGLTLVLIGIAFMIFEIYVSSFGAIGIGGVIAFIIGSVMLYDTHDPNYHLTLSIIISMSMITVAFFFAILTLAFRSHKKAIVTGREGLIGSEGIVLNVMNHQIIVRVLGEIWDARSTHMLDRDDKIKVVGIKGLLLEVEPLESKQNKPGESQ